MKPQLNWYLSAIGEGDTITPISVDNGANIGVYRRDDGTDNVAIQVDEETFDIGVRDRSVSRMRETGPPVRVGQDGSGVEIENADNADSVVINAPGKHLELVEGQRASVSRDCSVEVGYNTELLLTSEVDHSEDKEDEVTIEGGGEISVPAYVRLLCRHLRQTSRESVTEARSNAKELRNVVEDHPVDLAGYERALQRLESNVQQLESMKADTLTDDRVTKLNELATDIGRLYLRS